MGNGKKRKWKKDWAKVKSREEPGGEAEVGNRQKVTPRGGGGVKWKCEELGGSAQGKISREGGQKKTEQKLDPADRYSIEEKKPTSLLSSPKEKRTGKRGEHLGIRKTSEKGNSKNKSGEAGKWKKKHGGRKKDTPKTKNKKREPQVGKRGEQAKSKEKGEGRGLFRWV